MTEEQKALVPVDERQVEFYGDEITTVLVEVGGQNEVFVPIRPICDFLGVTWDPQRRRINRDPVLSKNTQRVTVTVTDSYRTVGREMICLNLDYLNGWLFGINASRVKDEVRERLIRYQEECYRVLARAFIEQRVQPESSTTATLMQVREMGRAIMQMAEEQIEFERRLSTTENRLDKADTFMGDLAGRVNTLEARYAPGGAVTEEQASQISQAVKAVAMVLTKQSGSSQYGAVYGELYRKFGITSYKMLPVSRFGEAMHFLTDWHQSLVGEGPF